MGVQGQVGLGLELGVLNMLHLDLVGDAELVYDDQRTGRAIMKDVVEDGLRSRSVLGVVVVRAGTVIHMVVCVASMGLAVVGFLVGFRVFIGRFAFSGHLGQEEE